MTSRFKVGDVLWLPADKQPRQNVVVFCQIRGTTSRGDYYGRSTEDGGEHWWEWHNIGAMIDGEILEGGLDAIWPKHVAECLKRGIL